MKYPLFNWLEKRGAGVLLHPTALPGGTGIGTMGREARQFIDFLAGAGMRYWQVCPLGPTGYGDSPYQSFSSFAGNTYLIDLESLMEFDLLRPDDLRSLRSLPETRVDFGRLYLKQWPILRLAFRNFKKKGLSYLPNYGFYDEFKERNADWLFPYASFMALKGRFNGEAWNSWPGRFGTFSKFQSRSEGGDLSEAIEAQQFFQYLFFGQWDLLRQYAKERKIRIIGDIPIFASLDSADVWSRPEYFQLGKNGQPLAVAGVPPDYFSPTGQLWGNPLYDWKHLKGTGYDWWLDRLEKNLERFDVVRLDHFRGFDSYWSIPARAPDARTGKWKRGPGIDFFSVLRKRFPEARIIAEDLGEITPSVDRLLARTGLPGIAVLQFAFDGNADNPYLPHNHSSNCVLYPGTHDNDTVFGWYGKAPVSLQDQVRRYFRISGEAIAWDFIRAAYGSVARLAIIPMQDLMNLDSSARLNRPGSAEGNWQWRYTQRQFDKLRGGSASYLKELASLTGRR